jgi:matrixin
MSKGYLPSLVGLILVLSAISILPEISLGARYYSPQTNFEESQMPVAPYGWNKENIHGCIFKEDGISNSYYVWAKLAVQNWRQALREYTEEPKVWNVTAHYIENKDQANKQDCDFVIYIYSTYLDFPDYPEQKGAYAAAEFTDDIIKNVNVYLSPIVLHGDGITEIELPTYAFRNSAVHEIGHLLGLSHMQSPKGYLMSPQFDYWDEKDKMPITTLELSALTTKYGEDGFE